MIKPFNANQDNSAPEKKSGFFIYPIIFTILAAIQFPIAHGQYLIQLGLLEQGHSPQLYLNLLTYGFWILVGVEGLIVLLFYYLAYVKKIGFGQVLVFIFKIKFILLFGWMAFAFKYIIGPMLNVFMSSRKKVAEADTK